MPVREWEEILFEIIKSPVRFVLILRKGFIEYTIIFEFSEKQLFITCENRATRVALV